MSPEQVKILDGNTFVVSDATGDIEASATESTGLFSYDTRYLSTWILTVDGQRLTPLSVDDLHYFETRFFLVAGTGTVYVDAKLSVMRHRTVCNGFDEELMIFNHDDKPVDIVVRLDAGTDFADVFEVKDAQSKKGAYYARVEESQLVLGYEREMLHRQTIVRVTLPAALPGVITGVMLAVARIVGETAPLLLTSYGSSFFPRSIDDRTPFLTKSIYDYARSGYPDWERQAWAASLVLVAFVMALNLGIRLAVGKRAAGVLRAD